MYSTKMVIILAWLPVGVDGNADVEDEEPIQF